MVPQGEFRGIEKGEMVGENYFCGGLVAKVMPFLMWPFKASVAIVMFFFSISVRPVNGLMAFAAPLVYAYT